jgi:hypothetical protein
MKCVLFPSTHFPEAFLTQEFIAVLINIYIDIHVNCLYFLGGLFNKNSIGLRDLNKKKFWVLYKLVACVHVSYSNRDVLSFEYLLQPAF